LTTGLHGQGGQPQGLTLFCLTITKMSH